MNQEWLIKNVLKNLDSAPDKPIDDRQYLSLVEAQKIVDDTIDYIGVHGDSIEYNYINGHRKRLAHSLSLIPAAKGKGESCLDVGSYGYMLFWVKKYLGYDHVAGIEWHPEVDEKIIPRTLTIGDDIIETVTHNFDISQSDWTLDGPFDTVLLFEVLEHINHDPMGVMLRIHDRLKQAGTLVMSVPNAISYKAFKEFLVGMPPWTYWFYEPDLSHEPRHCFEYTPIIFKTIIQAAGLRENAFRTIYAYTEQDREEPTLEIARSLGIEDESFGETMIINATKVSDEINVRYPDVLYSPDGYYKNIYPHLHDRLNKAMACFRDAKGLSVTGMESESETNEPDQSKSQQDVSDEMQKQINVLNHEKAQVIGEFEQSQELVHNLQKQQKEYEDRISELLFTCDCYLRKEAENEAVVRDVENGRDATRTEAHDTRVWAENLTQEINDLRRQVSELETEKAQVNGELGKTLDGTQKLQEQKNEMEARINELLFTCDCYLRKEAENDAVVRDVEKGRDAALTEAHDTRVWADNLTQEINDLRGQVSELETEKAQVNGELGKTLDGTQKLQQQKNEMEARINELLFTCDCYLRKEAENEAAVRDVEKGRDAALTEAHDTRVWAENLTQEINDLRGQVSELETEKAQVLGEFEQMQELVHDLQKQKQEYEVRINELLFTCDCYLRKEAENEVADHDVVNGRDAALREAHDTRVWAENLSEEMAELHNQMNVLESEKSQVVVELGRSQDLAQNLQQQRQEYEARINELLFTCDCYLRKEAEKDASVVDAEKAKDSALAEAGNTRVWAENLAKENTDLRGQVNELLFSCDCYLQQVNDPTRCVQVIREKRFRNVLEASKSIARKTPVLRTALRPVYRTTKKFIKRRI